MTPNIQYMLKLPFGGYAPGPARLRGSRRTYDSRAPAVITRIGRASSRFLRPSPCSAAPAEHDEDGSKGGRTEGLAPAIDVVRAHGAGGEGAARRYSGGKLALVMFGHILANVAASLLRGR